MHTLPIHTIKRGSGKGPNHGAAAFRMWSNSLKLLEQPIEDFGAILQTLRNTHWTAAALRTLEQFFTLLEKTIELQHWGVESNSSRGRQAGWKQQGGHSRDLTMTVVGFTVVHYLCTFLPPQNPYAHVLHLLLLLLLLPACFACLLGFALLHDQVFMLLSSLLATRVFFWGFFSCPLDGFFFSFDILAIFSNCSRDSPLYLLWWKNKGRSQSTCFFQTLVDALSLMRHKYSILFSGTVYTVHHHQLGEREREAVSLLLSEEERIAAEHFKACFLCIFLPFFCCCRGFGFFVREEGVCIIIIIVKENRRNWGVFRMFFSLLSLQTTTTTTTRACGKSQLLPELFFFSLFTVVSSFLVVIAAGANGGQAAAPVCLPPPLLEEILPAGATTKESCLCPAAIYHHEEALASDAPILLPRVAEVKIVSQIAPAALLHLVFCSRSSLSQDWILP